jgi:RNA polymerase sigma-70 factor (ECF subfamily)
MTETAQTLASLVAAVARQDRAAFRTLYGATSAKLYGIILRILVRRDLADEILQEVYVKIWERAGDFDAARASPITWMATVARNRALDEVRRVRPVSIEERREIMNLADSAPAQDDMVARSQDLARLVACLDRLEPERRELVRAAYIEGLSREALAERLNRPVATIKTWLHRSLKQLKDCLGQ